MPALLGAEQLEQLRASRCGRGKPDSRTPGGCRGTAPAIRSSAASFRSDSYHARRETSCRVLGESLGEPVRERLRHDRVVVVVLGLEARRELVDADAGGDGERAEVVAGRRDVVGEAAVRPRVAVRGLLPEEAEAVSPSSPATTTSSPSDPRARSRDTAGDEQAFRDDLVEQHAGRRRTARAAAGLLEDRRERALQLPGVEEELPVDVLAERRRAAARRARAAGERGLGEVAERDHVPVRPRLLEGEQRLARAAPRAASRSRSCSSRFSRSSRSRRSARAGRRRRRRRAKRRARAAPAARIPARCSPPCAARRRWRRRSAAAASGRGATSRARRPPSGRATA